MPRANRICFPGAVYHIFQRGNNKQDIFLDDADRLYFLKLLAGTRKMFNYLLHCYVLMNNHFHMTIETPSSTPISEIMQSVSFNYAVYFNKRHERIGHLFQDRFKGIMVEKDDYLLRLSRYVHLNPVKSGFVDLPEQYKWSSYRVYIESVKDELVYTDTILSYFGDNDTEKFATEYKNFVKSGISELNYKKDWLEENLIKKRFLGSRDFVKNFTNRCLAPVKSKNP